MLTYKAGNGLVVGESSGGRVDVDRINDDGSSYYRLVYQEWTPPGWTRIVPLQLGGKAHLLSYKERDGTVAVNLVCG